MVEISFITDKEPTKEKLNNHDIDEDICKQMGQKENCNEFTDKENCKNCIKQYFENKLKK